MGRAWIAFRVGNNRAGLGRQHEWAPVNEAIVALLEQGKAKEFPSIGVNSRNDVNCTLHFSHFLPKPPRQYHPCSRAGMKHCQHAPRRRVVISRLMKYCRLASKLEAGSARATVVRVTFRIEGAYR